MFLGGGFAILIHKGDMVAKRRVGVQGMTPRADGSVAQLTFAPHLCMWCNTFVEPIFASVDHDAVRHDDL